MFGWLRRLLSGVVFFRRLRDRDRRIFEFWDGSRYRRIDPLQALCSLRDHEEYRDDLHPAQVERGDMEATKITCDAVCRAFGVKPFDTATNTGLTIGELIELYATWIEYMEELKKSTGMTPTWQSPTESTSKESDKTTTSDTSDSTKTETDRSSVAPTA